MTPSPQTPNPDPEQDATALWFLKALFPCHRLVFSERPGNWESEFADSEKSEAAPASTLTAAPTLTLQPNSNTNHHEMRLRYAIHLGLSLALSLPLTLTATRR